VEQKRRSLPARFFQCQPISPHESQKDFTDRKRSCCLSRLLLTILFESCTIPFAAVRFNRVHRQFDYHIGRATAHAAGAYPCTADTWRPDALAARRISTRPRPPSYRRHFDAPPRATVLHRHGNAQRTVWPVAFKQLVSCLDKDVQITRFGPPRYPSPSPARRMPCRFQRPQRMFHKQCAVLFQRATPRQDLHGS